MPDRPSDAFLAAVANEQFGLQSAAGATIGESGGRAALYLSSLSSGLVAVGFASGSPTVLVALMFTVLPTVFVLGAFTVVRLVDTSVQNIVALQRVERIRRFWATLDTEGTDFFPTDTSSGSRGVRYGVLTTLFTTATMIAVVNSVLGGALAALGLSIGAGVALPIAVASGAFAGAIALGAALVYQRRRLASVTATSTSTSTSHHPEKREP